MTVRRKCFICDETFQDEESYFTHIKEAHYDSYNALIKRILDLNDTGYILTKDDERIEYDGNFNVQEEEYLYKSDLVTFWEPEKFDLEATTIWSFPDRGNWATHNPRYRGNWSPYIPRNIILRYSNIGDCVLDQFLGSGTTLVEAKLLKRRGLGIDINSEALKIAESNLNFKIKDSFEQKVVHGDARNLELIQDNSIELICTHPPYANIIKYSQDISGDLSLYEIDEFLVQMKKVADESYRVLKPNKYCAILMGDTRRKKHIVPLGFSVMQIFIDAGFIIKEIIIKKQHNCKATDYWYKKSVDLNFLLIAHEYLFVFRRPE